MKKIFFCLFSSIFVVILLWLGMYGEVYGYYTDNDWIYYIANSSDNDYKNLFKDCTDFSGIMSVLEQVNSFTNRTNRELELCNYAELFSDNYCYTIETYDSSNHYIRFYFNIPSNAYSTGKYSFDTKGLNIYYTTPGVPMSYMSINLRNYDNVLDSWTYQYLTYNAVIISPASIPNTNYTNFNGNLSETYTNLSLTFNNNDLLVTPSPIEPPAEEEEENILDFIANFWTRLIHVVIPDEEDFEDLQEEFNSRIIAKFAISVVTRSSNYNNTDLYPLEYANKVPVFTIYGYEFDGQKIKDFLNTPISLGRLVNYQSGSTTEHSIQVDTGGLTAFGIINVMFGFGIAFLNIKWFNKFFEKE